jgi:SAM-dependent methyltransferase
MSAGFYRAFEERHRGSRALIKSRQRIYLPFVAPLRTIYGEATAIDLGCGRGEWLELLKEAGFDAQGVDLDDGMLAACRERGLNVRTEDALAALKALPDASQSVVSAFHVVEHIAFSELQTLVKEALRALRPAGLLILETPNPENIVVGATSFYLDPSHHKPIPPQLLSFLSEYYGFCRTKVVRLQEDEALGCEVSVSLHAVLAGVSPDYAVVAQKLAHPSLLALSDGPFARSYGLTLESLAEKFDQQTKHALTEIAEQSRLTQQLANRAQSDLTALRESRSWRFTAPLRWLTSTVLNKKK